MPARNRKGLSEYTRERIKTSMIANRLTDHILGKVEMTASQVTAALGMLKKTLPDLQSQEVNLNANIEQRVISAEPITEDEFNSTYSVEPAKRAAESLN